MSQNLKTSVQISIGDVSVTAVSSNRILIKSGENQILIGISTLRSMVEAIEDLQDYYCSDYGRAALYEVDEDDEDED